MLPSNKLEGFTLRLFQLLPTLYSHRCSLQREGGFLMSEFTALSIFEAEKALPGNIQEHCSSAVHRRRSKRADMGVIGIDHTGEEGISFNSQRMFMAWCTEDGAIEARIF